MKWLRPIFYLFFSLAIVSCSESEQERADIQLHQDLLQLKTEIELHIIMSQFDSASVKLPKLVHSSNEFSPIELPEDYWTSEGWSVSLSRTSKYYTFSEYWNAQRDQLVKNLEEAYPSN